MVYAYGVDCKEREPPAPNAVDRTTNAIQLDLAKCVLCGRCVRVCEHVTGLNALQFARRGDKMTVEPAAGKQLKDTNCIQCGQCTLYCPVGACTEKNQAREVLNSIRNHVDKIMVAIVDPTVKINISDEMGLPAGTDSTGKVVSYLKQLGFDLVFDGAVGDDLMVQEEADLFVKRLKENKSKLPLFSSTCPAFVNFVEQSKPDLIKHLSTTRSPQAMMSSLVKNCLAKNWTGLTLHPEDFYCLTINSCVARKDEIERPAFVTPSGVKETDAAITTRELAQMMKLSNVKFYKLPQAEFSNIYNEGTGAAALLGTTGGLTEAMLRVAYEKATGKKLENVEFNALHGMNKVRVAEVDFAGQSVKVAVVDGISNARNLIEKIEAGDPTVKDVRYVEVLACPGGCVNGGGSPKFQDPAVMEKRANALHFVDEHKKLRKSSENPIVTNLLAGDLKDTKLVHQLLHTSFKARPKQ
ncbi:NADP-reducing hydrogenase subunit HndC [Tritrichomonas foetus]|uniref:NADP-reducing hydrogenase subunit HndC n=1 Tax=Tritrichomonas foetus TaxID=1144522 RepID=A0A1J4JQY9_9EUKA|nr:NADP-reducing hydrogenase subunit HndC [Tritrichomonas foetus]|eukprot:OHT01162.1 NADP-reducing hydrogenase subunit HndC [Tritrichomonas foetus]